MDENKEKGLLDEWTSIAVANRLERWVGIILDRAIPELGAVSLAQWQAIEQLAQLNGLEGDIYEDTSGVKIPATLENYMDREDCRKMYSEIRKIDKELKASKVYECDLCMYIVEESGVYRLKIDRENIGEELFIKGSLMCDNMVYPLMLDDYFAGRARELGIRTGYNVSKKHCKYIEDPVSKEIVNRMYDMDLNKYLWQETYCYDMIEYIDGEMRMFNWCEEWGMPVSVEERNGYKYVVIKGE